MEDPINCYVVGFVDTELLGLVFVLVGISLMRQTQVYIPHAKPSFHSPSPYYTFIPAVSSACRSSGPSPRSPSYHVFESDGDLLARQCPPPACIWGPCILQDVLSCDDMLSAELLGKCCLQTQGRGVGKAQTGQPSLYLLCLSRQRGQEALQATISKGRIMNREFMTYSQGERAHIHVIGDRGGGEHGWHQNSEWARCGKDLLAALLCRWRGVVSEFKWGAPEVMGLDV